MSKTNSIVMIALIAILAIVLAGNAPVLRQQRMRVPVDNDEDDSSNQTWLADYNNYLNRKRKSG